MWEENGTGLPMSVGYGKSDSQPRHVWSSGFTIWFTGLSGAGKTTLATCLYGKLLNEGYHAEVLDGDVIRRHLGNNLSFTRENRIENLRRIGYVAHLLQRNGVIVLVAAIAPYQWIREELRRYLQRYIEVYVNAPLDVCEARDVKGLYAKARKGELAHFTGIDDPYEPPCKPEIECRTDRETVNQSVAKIWERLAEWRFIGTSTYGLP